VRNAWPFDEFEDVFDKGNALKDAEGEECLSDMWPPCTGDEEEDGACVWLNKIRKDKFL
jgi:hypothetical protein